MHKGNTETAMKTREDIIESIRAHKAEIETRFTARSLGLFGSFAHGTAGPDSDIDIIVDMAEPTFDHYMDLKFYLEGLFGSSVDLVLADTIKPRLKPYIDRDLIYA